MPPRNGSARSGDTERYHVYPAHPIQYGKGEPDHRGQAPPSFHH